MSQGISGFITTWSSSYESTVHRVERRNVRQGGSDFLAAGPLFLQSMWAGTLMAEVAAVVSGPFYAIAQFFWIIFSPLIGFPLSILSCAAKEGFYEKSVSAQTAERTQYFRKGARVDEPVKGTVTLLVDGQERHFTLGEDISYIFNNTIIDEGKRYWFHRLEAAEVYDDRCRTVDLGDERGVRIKLEWEVSPRKYIEQEEGGRKVYYELGKEAAEPVQGTMTERVWSNVHWRFDDEHYLLEAIPGEAPNCIKVKSDEMTLFYDTGLEIDAPRPGSKSFVINGQTRHFASAKYVQHESIGLSGGLNMVSEKFLGRSILPTRLSRFAAKTLTFVNNHWSNVIRVAIIVSGLVFAYFGAMAMAAGSLFAVTYEYLDHDLGIIPQKVSLFMEKWMPTISMVGLLIVGSAVSQVMAGVSLLLMIPSVKLFVHHKVGKVVRKAMIGIAEPLIMWFHRGENRRPPQLDRLIEGVNNYPQLEECDAPLTPRRELNAAEIGEILQAENNAFELNPASLTHDVEPLLELEEDRSFNKLIELWDQSMVRWSSPEYYNGSYPQFVRAAAQNPHFIRLLQDSVPEATRFNPPSRGEQRRQLWDQYRPRFEEWVGRVAGERGVSREKFLADWLNYYRFLSRAADDKRFIIHLQTRFPEVKRFHFEYDYNLRDANRQLIPEGEQEMAAKVLFLRDIEEKIETLAEGKGVSKEQFVSDWIKEQLGCYVNKLNGTRPIEGEQRYLRDTMDHTAKILPFLANPETAIAVKEDTLLKLAVEGGDYCALGMSRASNEVLKGFTEPLILAMAEQLDRHKRLEHDVMQEFQKGRLRAVQGFYQMVTGFLKEKEQLQDVADDVHLYEAISRSMKRGFYPLNAEEMEDFSTPELLFSETLLLPLRVELKKRVEEYTPMAMASFDRDRDPEWGPDALDELDEEQKGNLITETESFIEENGMGTLDFTVDHLRGVLGMLDLEMAAPLENVRNALLRRLIGQNRILNYLRAWVNDNGSLTPLEKTNLLNGALSDAPESLRDAENYEKWHQLFLAVLGIYRKKAVVPAAQTASSTVLAAQTA